MTNLHKSVINRRRRHFIDRSLQGWYLVGLVLLEMVLFIAALYVLYQHLVTHVENQLYRFHFPDELGLVQLLPGIAMIMLVVVSINVVATAIVTLVWHLQVRSIVKPLGQLLEEVNKLDFSKDEDMSASHVVLDNAHKWKQMEKMRCQNIRSMVGEIKADVEHVETDRVKSMLMRLKQFLP